MTSVKSKSVGNPLWRSVLFGDMIAVFVSLAFSAIMAYLVSKGRFGEEFIDYASVGVVFLSTFVGCIVAGKRSNRKIAVCCGVTAVVFVLFLCSLTIFAFDTGFGKIIPPIIALLLGSVMACLICLGKGSRRKRASR